MKIEQISPAFVLTVLLGAALVLFFVMSVVFVFHWRRYEMKTRMTYMAESVYFAVSACFIAFAVTFYLFLL